MGGLNYVEAPTNVARSSHWPSMGSPCCFVPRVTWTSRRGQKTCFRSLQRSHWLTCNLAVEPVSRLFQAGKWHDGG